MKRVLKKLDLTTPATIYFDDESNKMSVANFQVWIWDTDIENKILGTALRQSEAQGFEASLDDGWGNQIDWRNDSRFAEKKEH